MEEAVFIAQQKVLEIGSAGGRDIFDEVLHVLKGAKSDWFFSVSIDFFYHAWLNDYLWRCFDMKL